MQGGAECNLTGDQKSIPQHFTNTSSGVVSSLSLHVHLANFLSDSWCAMIPRAPCFIVDLQDKNSAETAVDDFRKVATAYEILTDNETRGSYDYALAHPKEHLYNQYRFYRNRMYKEMKIPAQYTVTVVILIWSAVQYFTKEHMYQNVRSSIGLPPGQP